MQDFLGARWSAFLAALQAAARADAGLTVFSANADFEFEIIAGGKRARFVFSRGLIEVSDSRAPASASVSLEAPAEVWQKFFSAVPPAPYHGIYAMKMRVPEFKVTGSELALAQHMHLVRRVLELGRGVLHPSAVQPKEKRTNNSKDPIRGG